MRRVGRRFVRREAIARASDENGAVAVLVGILAVVLFSCAAFAVDLGSAWALRRKAQTSADAAALAGAQVIGGGNPVSTASTYASNNGFSSASVNNPPTSGANSGNANCVEVTVNQTVSTIFAGVMGIPNMTVGARAVACRTTGSGHGFAIFADSTTCPKTIDWSGSSTTVNGGVHTNRELYVGGSSNAVNGPTSYVHSINTPGGITLNPPAQQTPVQPMPVNFNIADYQPGGAKAAQAAAQGQYHNAGSNEINTGWLTGQGLYNDSTDTLDPGLYYTSNKIELSDSDIEGDGVTFVSSNNYISFSGSSHQMTPWDSAGLLAFSNWQPSSSCDTAAIKMAGSTHAWTGIIYAPRGMIEMSGSSNTTVNGSIIGHSVKLNGSGLNINYQDEFGGGSGGIELSE